MIAATLFLLVSICVGSDAQTEPELWTRSLAGSGQEAVLEIASRRYAAPTGSGAPDVWLVGVTHIGNAGYYDSLSTMLSNVDVVLYESVMPAGARPHVADNDTERRSSTQDGLDLLAGIAARCDQPPVSAEELAECANGIDLRMGGWVRAATVDAWGRPVVFMHDAEDDRLLISSVAADGQPGTDDDLVVEVQPLTGDDLTTTSRNLQAMLADALGLRFQLESMPYGAVNWRVSDMTIGQVEAAFAERGMQFDVLGDMLSGSSIPAQLINMMLALIPLGDSLSNGAVSDGIKVVLIELLGTPGVLNVADQQFGEGFHEVIVVERNRVPLDDLDRMIEREPTVQSVAILYGAAHMPDMAGQLVASGHGYEEAEARWDAAITVDLTKSSLSERDRKSIRRSMRLALAQIKRKARLAREAQDRAEAGETD